LELFDKTQKNLVYAINRAQNIDEMHTCFFNKIALGDEDIKKSDEMIRAEKIEIL